MSRFLSVEQERLLIAKIQLNQCTKSQLDLIDAFQPLVGQFMRRVKVRGGFEREDLLQEANQTIIETAYEFDLERSYQGQPIRFASFLMHRLRSTMQRVVRDQTDVIQRPARNTKHEAARVVHGEDLMDQQRTLFDILKAPEPNPEQLLIAQQERAQMRRAVACAMRVCERPQWQKIKKWSRDRMAKKSPCAGTRKALQAGRSAIGNRATP